MLSRLKDTMLLVGDTNSARADLRNIFKETFNLLEAENAEQAVLLLDQNRSCIALIIADLSSDVLSELGRLMAAASRSDIVIPVVSLVDSSAPEMEEQAFLLGASDVILKPYSPMAVRRRVQILADLFLHKWNLEKMVQDQSETIRNANQIMLDAMSAIIEYRSTESGNHVLRIRRFTKILLEEVARCCPEYELNETIIDVISSAAALHDIGKISIPDSILNKPGKLTEEEFEIMKSHTVVGSQMVTQLAGMGEELYLRYAYNISLYHHERWGGKGYPCGLAGDDIPICAQVVGLADAFDALSSSRVYKSAYSYQDSINMILNGECGEFSPKLLECFKHVRSQFVELAQQYADGYSPKSDHITVPLPGPSLKTGSRSSLELFQAKYQALLHYIGDTVLELDLDNGLYHVLYNPNPNLDTVISTASFREIVDSLRSAKLHPQDAAAPEEIYRFISDEFFQSDIRRRTFSFRIFSPVFGHYQRYELTLLRASPESSSNRIVTTIWRMCDRDQLPENPSRSALHASPALYGLVSSPLRCRNDRNLTIDAGASDLFPLCGYSQEEIAQQFGNQLLNLIIPEDRDAFRAAMEKSAATGGKSETEFRLFRSHSDPIWVLAKSRIHLEADGQEYFYLALRDNIQSKQTQQKLLSDIQRNQILIDQSGGIVFEWDLISDTMYCSPKWEEHFGYVPVSENYGHQLGIATHFHPDDLLLIRTRIQDVMHGVPSISMDVRVANSEGKYLWTKITAASLRNEKREIYRIIGILQDIDELKRAALVLKERADRDSLTKLLNKESVQSLVSDYLATRPPHALAGLLVLDLDNFKSINDTLGHLYGDVVLTQVGSTLRKLFRSQDIIGRIGGDEFLILLKDIPSVDLLCDRCQSLLESLRILLQNLTPDLQVSCSVGAASAPLHGSTYNELFRHADEALYNAKSRGKNQYKLYNPQDKYVAAMDAVSRSTTIDSDDPSVVTNNSFERFVIRCLYESRDFPSTINELLAFVGNQFNLSRSYVFENNDDNTACSNTFEWCNDGVEPQIDNLQDVSYITDIPGWPDVYDERGIFYCTDITQLAPQFRDILEPQGIKSMLHCAIMDQGTFRGYVGFDECFSNRLWTQEQLHQLEFLAEALCVFLGRQRRWDRSPDAK